MEIMMGRIFLCLLTLLSLLPRKVSQGLGKLVGRCHYRLDTRVTKVSRVNIGLCNPSLSLSEQENLVYRNLMHSGQLLMEIPAVWSGSKKRLAAWIESVQNESILIEAKQSGRGVIVLLPHFGNWELFNVYYTRHGSMTALYQPPKQTYLRPVMKEVRQLYGNELVATNVKGIARLYRCLEQGKVVTILPDQVPATGIYAPFFNVDTFTDPLIPRLIRKTGALVVAVLIRRLHNGRFSVEWYKVDNEVYNSDIAKAVRAINQTVEDCIAVAPDQYQWGYKRFKKRPAGLKKIYRFNKPERFHQ